MENNAAKVVLISSVQKAFICGVISTAIIMSAGIFLYKEGIQAGSVIIKAETGLDFRCEPGTKLVIWQMVNKGVYKGELQKRCIK